MNSPTWSKNPLSASSWSIEEIKNGVIVNKYALTKACVYFGRAEDEVDVVTAHASCSRIHARIAFDNSGTPFIQDLKSGNGTIVNKIPVQKGENEEVGTQIFPGDVIRFGASTRIYCLLGPPEFERSIDENLSELKIMKRKRSEVNVGRTEKGSEAVDEIGNDDQNGIGWGIDMNEYNDEASTKLPDLEDITSISEISLDASLIPPQTKKVYEKFMAKKLKLSNIQLENDRISKKNIEGLTAGQERQLEKNQSREREMIKEIKELYSTLVSSMQEQSNTKIKLSKKTKKRSHYDDDIDDFYDKTKKEKNASSNSASSNKNNSASQQSLTAKWSELVNMIEKINGEISRHERNIQNLKTKSNHSTTDEDSFFIQNDIKLIHDSIKTCRERKSQFEKQVNDVEESLLAKNKNLKFDREIGVIS